MPKTYCPDCDAAISIANPSAGDRLNCPDCNVELEVISTDPLDVYFPFDEDWDEDEDDDDDEDEDEDEGDSSWD